MAQVYEPLPEPVPVHEVFPGYPAPQAAQYQPVQYYPQPVQVIHPSPELAMAKAAFEPLPTPVPQMQQPVQPIVVPAVRPDQFSAPIPELEPIRYHRVANNPPPTPVPVPLMMSSGNNRAQQRDSREMQRALAPLSQPSSTGQDWVSSTTTAMRGYGF